MDVSHSTSGCLQSRACVKAAVRFRLRQEKCRDSERRAMKKEEQSIEGRVNSGQAKDKKKRKKKKMKQIRKTEQPQRLLFINKAIEQYTDDLSLVQSAHALWW